MVFTLVYGPLFCLLYCKQPNVSNMRDPKKTMPSSMEMVNFSNETPKFLRVLRFKRRLLIVKIWGVKQAAVVISRFLGFAPIHTA